MKKYKVADILPILENVKEGTGGQYTALCPCHDDKNNSFSIGSDKDGFAVCNCFAGCPQASIWNYIYNRLGKPWKPEEAPKRSRVLVASYDYIDKTGEIIDTKYRYNPKSFSWKKGTAGRRKPLPLYRVRDLLEAKSVFVVEGEKDTNTLSSYGIIATSSKDGFTLENMEDLSGKDLYIIQDNDTKGEAIARKAAETASGFASSIRIIDLKKLLPSLPPKGDISDYIEAGGSVQALEAFARSAPLWIPEEEGHPHDHIYKNIEHFSIDKGILKYTNGENITPVCFGTLAIIEEVKRHNGEEIEIYFKVEGVTEDGKTLPPVLVSASDLSSLNWIPKAYGSKIVPAPTQTAKQKLLTGLLLSGRQAKQTTVYTHTGYIMKDNKPLSFIHAGGHLEGPDTLEASIINNLKQYRLEAPSRNGSERAAAARASLDLLKAHKASVTFPLFAFVYLAPIMPIVKQVIGEAGFCLYLQGKTQSGKSTLASLALSHFGTFSAMTPPVTFNSTANYINELSFLLKDCILWIDDYHPQGTKKEADKQAQIFQSIARAAGDHAQRGRLTSSAKLQALHNPRCLFLATGEDLPTIGQSGIARLFILNVSRDRADIKDLLKASRSGILSRSMSDYICFIITHFEEVKAYFEKVYNKAVNKVIDTFGESRLSGQATLLYCAAVCFLHYCKLSGILEDKEASSLNRAFWGNIFQSAKDIEKNLNNQDPAHLYIKALKDLLSSGQKFVKDLCAPSKYELQDALGAEGIYIGWKDTQYFYMDPHASYKAVADYYQKEGSFFNYSRQSVQRDLLDIGAIINNGDTTPTITKKISNYKSCRVLRFNISTLTQEGGFL
jgi:hypothetical protein